MRVFRGILYVTLLLVVLVVGAAGGLVWLLARNAAHAPPAEGGTVHAEAVPPAEVAARTLRTRVGERSMGAAGETQILFGDLHVHTTFSNDALAFSMPMFQEPGARPPADACDFARYCSQLDFWSINDHAESLWPAEWRETREAIASCNAVAEADAVPDTIAFLGWEWSQGARTPEEHYGHKNVILRDHRAPTVPARPIASGWNPFHVLLSAAASLSHRDDWEPWSPIHRRALDHLFAEPVCPDDAWSPALPPDCREIARTPDRLFEKLDQWEADALVIPHGLAWGITNPAGADVVNQIGPPMHDPKYQRLIEVYSGHGNSELFRPAEDGWVDAEGRGICPQPGAQFEPCCHRVGELVRARCEDPGSAECAAQVEAAREEAARLSVSLIGRIGGGLADLAGASSEELGDCGQLRDEFLPAFDYEPRGSTQYGVSLGDFSADDEPSRWRLGFIAASDNHSARPGTGYKEFGRTEMTEGMPGFGGEALRSSYFYTGGLTAVHADGRDADAIFDALRARRVYGTSGGRILLHFDEIAADESRLPMGSIVESAAAPRFEVMALGAFEQREGCPAFVEEKIGAERLDWLCMNECFHPGDRRHRISRVEVVRIRPQMDPAEDPAELIEDPWKVLPCPEDGGGCRVAFDDPEYVGQGREFLYYVRAIQEPTGAVNGAAAPCLERADDGRCLRLAFCPGTAHAGSGAVEDCVAPVEERAWSSPIWRRPPRMPPPDQGARVPAA